MIMTVGENSFAIEDRLAKKLDIMCDRVTKTHPKLDACLENSGYEGEGKTNASIIEAAYIKQKTGMKINLFFKTESCLRFAQSTENQIIILDEPAFDLLSTDHASKMSKDFLRLTSTVRKKRHFFIINFAKFWKFPEHLVVDRALGMIHLYSRGGTEMGRFVYIRKNKLEALWNGYKKGNKRMFGELRSFGGKFSFQMEKIFDISDIRVERIEHATIKDYERQKDLAIASIGQQNKKVDKNLIKLDQLRYKLTRLIQLKVITQKELAKILGSNPRTLQDWAKNPLKEGFSLGKGENEEVWEPFIINTRDLDPENDDEDLEEELITNDTNVNNQNATEEDEDDL